ncbi:MAG: arsenite efflux transporter metallochaperone ArsD [Polyangiaceae bacterium]
MISVRVFDPAMCCSTGICGPSVDPRLARFAADLDWLKSQGAAVERFNLSQQPAAFADDAAVKAALEAKGEAGLPLVKVNGEVKSSGTYPSRDELAAWAGVVTPPPEVKANAGGCCGPSTKSEEPAPKAAGCCGTASNSESSADKKSSCC